MSRNFEHLVLLYRDIKFDNSEFSEGSLIIDSQQKLDILHDILSDANTYGLNVESGNVALGQRVLLNVRSPRVNVGKIYRNFSHFLENPKNRVKEPKNYYIFSLSYYNKDIHDSNVIKRYKLILKFISLLKESEAYLDEINCELVYFDKDIVKIPLNYQETDIDSLDENCVSELFSKFTEDTHRDQKLTILGNSVKSICGDFTRASAFSSLLNGVGKLKESFDKGYKAFVSGFSYEKIVDQLRTAKVEEMGKIHKTFSDIQNHILGIPVATVIVATQLKETASWNGQAIINSAIMAGSIIFALLVLLVLCNQFQTLNAIKEEIKYKKAQIDKNYSLLSKDVSGTFKSLFCRLRIQKTAMVIIGLILIFGVILTLAAYLYFTKPALVDLIKIWKEFSSSPLPHTTGN
ncbi:TPA: hypothetical protein ACKPZ3_003386 [Serratia marcescens]